MKILDNVFNLSNVPRFLGKRLDMNYNVAEHSYRVAIISMVLVDEWNVRNPDNQIDQLEVLKKALLHDLEESILGDIPSPVKKIGNLRDQLREASLVILDEHILDKELSKREEYMKLWKEDKDGVTGRVIVFADLLEIFIVASKEVLRGNKIFVPIKSRTEETLRRFEDFSKFEEVEKIINFYK